MKTADICKLRKEMERNLDPKRFEHTLGVAYTAAALAMCYDEDLVSAQVAGLLHDCAKCMTDSKRLAICEKHNIQISQLERQNPFLLHAKAGSYIAMEKYGVRDRNIINAILNHTTGRPGMGRLEKIIYVADYIEPCRKKAPNLEQLRKLAFQDLDEALFLILADTLTYLNSLHVQIDPLTQKTYDYYREQRTAGKEVVARQASVCEK